MHRFPKQSVLPNYKFVKFDFGAGLGYYVSSAASRALLARLATLTSDTTHQSVILPTEPLPQHDSTSISTDITTTTINNINGNNNNNNNKDQNNDLTTPDRYLVSRYVDSLVNAQDIHEHTALNVERSDMYDLDHFFTSVELALDVNCYSSLACTAQGGRNKMKFQRLPFQQFMMLDSILTMINRSGLSEHRTQILMHIKTTLGYDWLSWTKADILQKFLSVRIVGNHIRRRMGKSVAVIADIARCLSYFPVAGIKALYTVHKAHAAKECHSSVSTAVEIFVNIFNRKQKCKFQDKINARGGSVDPFDFYYQAKVSILHAITTVTVLFYKLNRNGDCNDGKPISKNTLLCKGYTQQDVS